MSQNFSLYLSDVAKNVFAVDMIVNCISENCLDTSWGCACY